MKFCFKMWGHLCFPEWKQKPQKRKYKVMEEQNEQVKDRVEDGQQLIQMIKKIKQENEKNEDEEVKDEEEEEDGDRTSTTTTMTGAGDVEGNSNDVNDRLCHICM
jgi:predicted RNase H-like nuclease (RuvC/YqgF family)